MMRIAYVCADRGVPVFGSKGCSVHVQEVVRGLLRRGHEVVLIAARRGGERPRELRAVRCVKLRADDREASPGARRSEAAARAVAARVGETLAADGPFDLVYERHALWSDGAMTYARAHGIPGLLEVNAPLIEEQCRYRSLEDRPAAEAARRRAFGAADALLAVSDGVAAHAASSGAPRNRIHVVPNGVDPGRFAPRPARAGALADPVIGFVGTLKQWHGVEILVEALALVRRRHPHARLRVVGDGPQRDALVEAAREACVDDAVDFAGAVLPAEIPGELARLDVACAPYPPLAGFYFSPLKVLEYQAAGLPVVASAIGQLTMLLDEGRTGLLVEPGDPRALADAISRIATDGALRCRLGADARASVEARHTWDRVAQRIERVAESLRGGCRATAL